MNWFGLVWFSPYHGYEATIVSQWTRIRGPVLKTRETGPPPRPGSAAPTWTNLFHCLSFPASSPCQLRLTKSEYCQKSPQRHLACVFSTRDRSLLSGNVPQSLLPRFRPTLAGLQRLQDPQPSQFYLSLLSLMTNKDKASSGTGNGTQVHLQSELHRQRL